MRKLKRILTGLLAVVLVISNLSVATLTVNAAEIDNTIVTTEGEGEGDVTEPTAEPTDEPEATEAPTEEPEATEEPSAEATEEPSAEATEEPSAEATEEPSAEATEEPTEEPAEETVVTYDFTGWDKINGYQNTNEVVDGVNTIVYEAQFAEIFYAFPEDLDAAKVTKVELVLAEGEGVALKLYNNADGTGEQTPKNYGLMEEAEYRVGAFGIMNMAEGENTVAVSGVKFTLGAEDMPEKPAPTPKPTPDAPAEPAATETITLTFAGEEAIAVADASGATVDIDDAGAATITNNGQYQAVFFELPESLTTREIQKVTFNTEDATSSFAFKVFAADTFASDKYGAGLTGEPAIYGNPVQVIPAESQSGIGYVAVMSMAASDFPTIKIDSISFECAVVLPTELTLTFAGEDAITVADASGATVEIDEAGAATITNNGQYQAVFFELPEVVSGRTIEKITFNTSDATSSFAFKVFAADTFASDKYGAGLTGEPAIYGNPVQVIPEGSQSGIGYVAVMSMAASDFPTLKIDSITFNMKASGGGSLITYGENIIVNPYFEADGDLSVWNSALSHATLSSVTSETPIADTEITTYGKVDRDAEWKSEDGKQDARHEFLAQDITANVKIGSEYKVEFYAMLDAEDYKDAPANQRVLDFAPYLVTAQGETKYLGSYSSQISGNLSKTLEPGVWTKFSGTFNVTDSGAIEKVVIRFVEQGTAYGDIAGGSQCVKGDYYVTGVSMTEIMKPKTTIEEDLVGWKTAITGAFGDDAIAGTCLGNGTITYDYLQALAKKHFNAITFENEQKPDITLGGTPNIGEDGYPTLNFGVADNMMAMIKKWNDEDLNDDVNFKIRGHVLVWHSQTPEWFFHEDYDASKPYVKPDVMNKRLEEYIKDVFDHYKGVVYEDGTTAADLFYGWDVVNEAMSDGTGKPRKASDSSSWAAVYGDESDEYIVNAFRYANKYAPANIQLYYNDYNDSNEPKASGIAALVTKITSHESDAELPTRIDGVGMQAHHNYADPTANQIMAAAKKYLAALSAEGNDGKQGNVQMTELDVKRSSSYDGTAATLKNEHAKQAWRFKEIFDAYRMLEQETPGCVGGITMWGITDETSWLQSQGNVGGGSSGGAHAPLLFFVEDYVAKAKPAYWAFMDAEKLDPATQDVTVNQQLVANSFADGNTYVISDADVSGSFIPVWNENGLSIKVNVEDATDDGANDTITVYIDEEMKKAEGDYAKVTVARNAEGVISTETGYETVINIDMETAITKKFSFDIAISNNGAIGVFNDKKETQATTSVFYAEAIMKPYATIKKGTATIDGKLDALWLGAEAIPMTISAGEGKAKASGTAKFMWDEEYLYAFYEVKDEVLDDTAAEVHAKDSIEVFIDENNNKADGYEADTHQYRVNFKNEQTFGTNSSAENLQSATRVVEGGYVLETAFKWTHITPEAGDKVGLEFQINDAEKGGRIGTMSWYDTSGSGWSTSKVFGTVTLLADEVVAPEKDPALGDVDTDDLPIGSTAEDIPEALWISGVKDGKIADRTFEYTGSAIKPTFNVFDGKKKLVEGTDYKVTYANNVKAAASTAKKAPTATITGIGNYESKVVVKFDIKKVNVNSLEIDDTIVVNKTNKVQKPVPVVTFNGKALKKDTDFTVSYPTTGKGAYKNGGTYDIVIKGKGNFEGEFTVTFVIDDDPYDISEKNVAAEDKKIVVNYDMPENNTVKYEKGGVKPAVEVLFDGVALVEGKDYKVTYANATKAAAATAKKAPTITVKGIGYYKGTITQKFSIEKQDIAVAEITTKDIAFNPAGKVNKTTVKLVDVNGKALKAKTDYSATFKYTYKEDTTLLNVKDGAPVVKTAGTTVAKNDKVPAGTVILVTVTGAGNYAGSSIVGEYTVVPASIASAKVTIKAQGYTGSEVTFEEDQITSVKIGKTTLKAEDYAIVADSFDNNVVKSTKATVVIEGTGNYTGTVTAKFTIKAKGFSLTDFFSGLFN